MKALYLLVTGLFLVFCSICFGQTGSAKISPDAASYLQTKKSNERVRILVAAADTTTVKWGKDVIVLRQYQTSFLIEATVSYINKLSADTAIQYIGLWRQPKEELTTGAFDLSLNNLSLVHDNYPLLNGNNIIVSIKEQQFDTTDIDFRNRVVNIGVAAPTQSVHASIMATIIGGGANSSPFAKGAAWGSRLASSDFATLLPDANQVYTSKNIHLQNHSYGTGIENFYGVDAAAYDASVYTIPTLVHVFSAGNSGTASSASGIYSGIAGFANLTGSFKMAKNVITVGHSDSAYTILPLSSKGPTYDGRIKPDLVAFGEDGSSGAAALASGTVALLQQAYKNSDNNGYPSAALVKAVLINSADDLGPAGPDFKSGYGNLNAYNAIKTIVANNFIQDTVNKNGTKNFSITIPPNAKQVKITVAWTDTAAAPNAAKALVNDLDAAVVFNAQTWLPWVLSHKPSPDSLTLAALRGIDTLNNVEQIELENPQAGLYQLVIKGSKMVSDKQAFAVAYQVDTVNSFSWTYPSASTVLKAGARNYIRWQTNYSGIAAIDYSTDKMSWQSITTSVDLSKGFFIWNTPDTTSLAYLRMRPLSQTGSFQTDTFVISSPLQLKPGFACTDSFLLYWNKLPVLEYQLYILGNQYLQPFQTVADTAALIRKSQTSGSNFAVAPKVGNKSGLRSFTIDYANQGVGCYVSSFYSVLQNGNQALLTLNLGTTYTIAEIAFQKEINGGFTTIRRLYSINIVSSYIDANLTQGVNRYRAQIRLTNGSIIYSDVDQVLYFPAQPVVIFPNPVAHNNPVNIIVKDQGIYSVQVYDAAGRLVKMIELNNLVTNLSSFILSKGVYFIKITNAEGILFTQKLIVY